MRVGKKAGEQARFRSKARNRGDRRGLGNDVNDSRRDSADSSGRSPEVCKIYRKRKSRGLHSEPTCQLAGINLELEEFTMAGRYGKNGPTAFIYLHCQRERLRHQSEYTYINLVSEVDLSLIRYLNR